MHTLQNRLKSREDLTARTSCCCMSVSFLGLAKLPECCGAGHYCALCCMELFFQYGLDHDFGVEPCCGTCRYRRTPCFAPCVKFETTCTIVDCKLALPCDQDQPLEISLCGWTCYVKKELVKTTGMVLVIIKTVKVHDMKPMEILGEIYICALCHGHLSRQILLAL